MVAEAASVSAAPLITHSRRWDACDRVAKAVLQGVRRFRCLVSVRRRVNPVPAMCRCRPRCPPGRPAPKTPVPHRRTTGGRPPRSPRRSCAGRLVRHVDVDVDPIALRPRRIHLLEPDSGPRPDGSTSAALQFGPRFVGVSRDRLPERPHQRDVERVDGDFERLHSTRPRLPSPGCQCARHVVRQPNVAPGDPADVGGLQPQHGPVRADVDGQMSLSVGADRRNGK